MAHAIVPRALVLALVPLVLAGGACSSREEKKPESYAFIPNPRPGSPTKDAGDGSTPYEPPPLEPVNPVPPKGWRRWEYPPEDCALFVPEDLSVVEPIVWEDCPFMPDGCRQAGAPWAKTSGWGYGNGISTAVREGHTYLATHRSPRPTEWESLLYRDGELIGAWAERVLDGGCRVAGPAIGSDGMGMLQAVRVQNEVAPVVYFGPVETLMAKPERTETFGPPDAAVLTRGIGSRSDKLWVLEEHYGRFTVRDITTGSTRRPEPPGGKSVYAYLEGPIAVGDSVYYTAWNNVLSSVWVHRGEGPDASVLRDGDYSYDRFVSDGADAAWCRGKGPLGLGYFETIELFVSKLGADPTKLVPKKLADVVEESKFMPMLSIGEGWVAVRMNYHEVRLIRIADGEQRALPEVPEIFYSGGQNKGLRIADGSVYVLASHLEPSSDKRFLFRFEIDKLEKVPPMIPPEP